jgi:hypothetical protein
MKKNFPLSSPKKAPGRVVDAIKHDVRTYVKRERRKPLPEGASGWEFDCRVGPTAAEAAVTELTDVGRAIDAVVATGVETVYIEVVATPVQSGASPS